MFNMRRLSANNVANSATKISIFCRITKLGSYLHDFRESFAYYFSNQSLFSVIVSCQGVIFQMYHHILINYQ